MSEDWTVTEDRQTIKGVLNWLILFELALATALAGVVTNDLAGQEILTENLSKQMQSTGQLVAWLALFLAILRFGGYRDTGINFWNYNKELK